MGVQWADTDATDKTYISRMGIGWVQGGSKVILMAG